MTTPLIAFLDRDTFAAEIAFARPAAAHRWAEYPRTAAGEIVERIADATVVIVNKVPLSGATLAQAPRLRLVLVAATGTDNVDLEACRERGIRWQNVVGYGTSSVVDHVFTLILALRRNLIAYRDSVIAGRWQKSGQFCFHDYSIRELRGARLVLIGSGTIGREVARIGEAFGMETILAARKGEPARDGRVAFDDAIAAADIISLHCPLTAETRGLLSQREFGLMKRRPVLINTARGALIDAPALVEAIRSEQLSAVGLDVLAVEPPAPDNALQAILALPNVIITPHIAWAGRAAQQRLADMLCSNLDKFLKSAES
jgi:glycerate dehydrogenase